MSKEKCILCGKETLYDIETHIDFRVGYIEGAGQLCTECHNKGDIKNRKYVTIPESLIENNPNNYDLGARVREYYYTNFK